MPRTYRLPRPLRHRPSRSSVHSLQSAPSQRAQVRQKCRSARSSLVASLFGFSRIKSFAAIALGVLGCGVIMCLASYGVLGFLSFLV